MLEWCNIFNISISMDIYCILKASVSMKGCCILVLTHVVLQRWDWLSEYLLRSLLRELNNSNSRGPVA